MKLWKNYKPFIIAFGVLFWGIAKIAGIKEWGSIIFFITLLLSKIDDIIEYVKKIGIGKFVILISIFMITCILTAFVFMGISNRFILKDIHKILIIILGLTIDILIIGYSIKKLETSK